jgi:phage terminase large subunit-like protein
MDNDIFTGALIIDDPVKPDDAYYDTKRDAINNRYNETIASRLAVESVPIIVIMQRIHYNDLAGYLLMGGSGENWHHLNLPVIIDNEEEYPEEYTHGIPIQHGLKDGWLWPYKHNEAHRVALESHRRKYRSQYAQRPPRRDEEQMVWQESDIKKAQGKPFEEPKKRTVVAVDPAASNTKTSDEHGIVAASSHGRDKYTVEQDLSRKGTPKQWADTAIYLYESLSADAIVIELNQGGDMAKDTLRNAGFKGKIIGVHASKGKVTRAEPIAALYAQDYVRHNPGLSKLEDEQLDFDPVTGKSNGVSPNRVDAVVWALTELSKKGTFMIS